MIKVNAQIVNVGQPQLLNEYNFPDAYIDFQLKRERGKLTPDQEENTLHFFAEITKYWESLNNKSVFERREQCLN